MIGIAYAKAMGRQIAMEIDIRSGFLPLFEMSYGSFRNDPCFKKVIYIISSIWYNLI